MIPAKVSHDLDTEDKEKVHSISRPTTPKEKYFTINFLIIIIIFLLLLLLLLFSFFQTS